MIKYILPLVLFLFSCSQENKNKVTASFVNKKTECINSYSLRKLNYSKEDTLIQWISKNISEIDKNIKENLIVLSFSKKVKRSSTFLYKKKKIVNKLLSKNYKNVSLKYEVYNFDNCNYVAKMTKYFYQSRRVKAIYYFLYQDDDYKGCLILNGDRLIKKSKKYLNISNEELTLSWSNRIKNNMINKYFK